MDKVLKIYGSLEMVYHNIKGRFETGLQLCNAEASRVIFCGIMATVLYLLFIYLLFVANPFLQNLKWS